jgi:hypothetical protein
VSDEAGSGVLASLADLRDDPAAEQLDGTERAEMTFAQSIIDTQTAEVARMRAVSSTAPG